MQKNINSILMRTVAVLLMLVLLSTAMVTGRFARYTSSASGEDSARVAKFDVTLNKPNQQAYFSATILPGETAPMNISIINKSEVAVALEIQVDNVHENLPIEIVYPVTGQLAPGKTGNIPLMIYWPEDDNSSDYCGMVDLLKLSITAVQVD